VKCLNGSVECLTSSRVRVFKENVQNYQLEVHTNLKIRCHYVKEENKKKFRNLDLLALVVLTVGRNSKENLLFQTRGKIEYRGKHTKVEVPHGT